MTDPVALGLMTLIGGIVGPAITTLLNRWAQRQDRREAREAADAIKGGIAGVLEQGDGHMTELQKTKDALVKEVQYLREGGIPSPATSTGQITQDATTGEISTDRRKGDVTPPPGAAP